jgi:YHS domain-containing protein
VARVILLFILVLVAARFVWRLIETVLRAAAGPFDSAQGRPAPAGGRGARTPAAVKMQPCPVCGTYVVPGKAISAVSNGAPVYFCSDKCRAEYQSR